MINISRKHLIHTVLGHSYITFIIFFCLAIFADQVLPLKLRIPNAENIGSIVVLVGTILITWAQMNSRKTLHERHNELRNEQAFRHGPYKFLRSPTQAGLFLLLTGLGITIKSIWVIIFTVFALVINILFFIRKQEKILENNYGSSYRLYKNKVKF